VLDDELINTLARSSQGSQRLKFRKITIGTETVTLLVLKRTKKSEGRRSSVDAQDGRKNKHSKSKNSKSPTKLKVIEDKQEQDSLSTFVPAFPNLEAMKSQVHVKPRCIIYPVTRTMTRRTGPGSPAAQPQMVI